MNVKTLLKLTVCPVVLLSMMLVQPTESRADSEQELRDAVTSLNSWLGADVKSRGWRQFLALNKLDTQAALGHRADAAVLNDILQRFNQEAEGLDHPAFNRVRYCIELHLDQLSRTPADIRYAAAVAKSQYHRAELKDLEILRNDAVYNLKMLKRFYKVRFSSRPRAELFYLLQPDKFGDYLKEMEFQLAPERTEKAIETEIESVENMIEMIDEQKEQLNEQRQKIQNWLDDLKDSDNRDDSPPPSPDDDDGSQADPSDSETTTIAESLSRESVEENSRMKPRTGAGRNRSFDLQENEEDKQLLINKQEDLEKTLEELRVELDQLAQQERERLVKFRDSLRAFNKFLDPYKELRAMRNDVYFAQAFEGLERLKAAFLAAARPTTESDFDERMEEFPNLYESLAVDNDRRAAAEIGNLTGWLEAAGQTPDLVAAVRRQHSLPNLHFEISDYLVNQVAGRDTNEVRRVNEQILSRLIRGIAYVNGNVSIQFIPDNNQVRAAIDLTGGIESHTFTRAGKFTAYAGANGNFNARRDIFANVGGMFATDPYGDLDLGSYFKGIDSSCDLVQKLAVKGYRKTKYQAEAISQRQTREELFESFEDETNEAIEQGFDRFEDLNLSQTDTSQALPALHMFTTSDRLVIKGHRATRYDLAAPKGPQFFNQLPADIHAKIHESLLSNYASPLLAGRRLTNTEIAETFRDLLGREPADTDQAPEDFSIKFAEVRPIQIEFEGNRLAVTITGDEFSRDRNRIKNGLEIRVAFRIERGSETLTLVPDGDVTVELVDPKKTNIATVSFKSFLENRLSEVLAQAESNSIEIPNNLIPLDRIEGEAASDIADNLELVQFRLDDGWLYAGWKYSPDNSLFHGTTDTPAIWFPMAEAAPTLDTEVVPDELQVDLPVQLDLLDADADPN